MRYLSTLSLRARLALWAITSVVLAVVSLATLAGFSLHSDLRATAESTQGTLVKTIAQEVDDKLQLRLNAVTAAASTLSGEHLQDRARLGAWLQGAPVLRGLFDSILVVDVRGVVVADAPAAAGRVGISVADRAYFRTLMSTSTPLISEPVANKTTGEPTVVIAAPIRDAASNTVGVLIGSIILTRANFLATLTHARIGQTGYFYVASKGDNPKLVLHPQAKRIMTPVPSPQQNPQLHRALGGFEGTADGVNSVGLHALFTFHHLKAVPWVLVAVYPVAEAFAPLHDALLEIALFAAAIAGFAGVLMWHLSARLVRPLEALRQQMGSAMSGRDEEIPRLSSVPELEDLRGAYNELRRHKREAEAAQRDSEEQVRRILQHAADAFVSLDSSGHVVEWNRAAEETFGWSRAEVIGRSLHEVVIPHAQREAHIAGWARFATTGAGPVVGKRIEVTAVHRDGHEIPIELSVVAQRHGDTWKANAFMRDISERKAAERSMAMSERRWRAMTDNIPAFITLVDREGQVKAVNRSLSKALHTHPAALVGLSLPQMVGKRLYGVAKPHIDKVLEGEVVSFEATVRFGDGMHHLLEHYVPERDADGTVTGFYTMALDITDRKRAEQRVVESENRMRTIADNLPVLIAYVGADRRYKFCNATYGDWFGRPASEVLGRHHDELGPSVARRQAVDRALGGERVELDEEYPFPSGLRHVHSTYIPDLDANGEVLGVHALTADVTQSKLEQERLATLARHDALTGLPNRRHFEEVLHDAALRSQRAHRPMALLFLDIDHFKTINDTYGHDAGDAVLATFAARLRGCVRSTDTVARLAGDEFTIILEALGAPEEAAIVADKVLASMAIPLIYEGTSIPLSTSIGVATYDGKSGDPGTLIRRADEALYDSKAAGRATYRSRLVA